MVGEGRAWWVWREGWQRQAGGLGEALVRPAAILVSPEAPAGTEINTEDVKGEMAGAPTLAARARGAAPAGSRKGLVPWVS